MKPTHPGEILRIDFLDELNMTATALATALRIPTNRVTEILNERRAVTADTALRLARFFGTSPAFWMNLQASYDLRTAEIEMGGALEDVLVHEGSVRPLPGVQIDGDAWDEAMGRGAPCPSFAVVSPENEKRAFDAGVTEGRDLERNTIYDFLYSDEVAAIVNAAGPSRTWWDKARAALGWEWAVCHKIRANSSDWLKFNKDYVVDTDKRFNELGNMSEDEQRRLMRDCLRIAREAGLLRGREPIAIR